MSALESLVHASPREMPGLTFGFAYIFLVVATISLVKPLRNALFIESFGVEALPYAYLGVAAASALFIWVYSRLSNRVGTRALILSSLWTGAGGLLAFWIFLAVRGDGAGGIERGGSIGMSGLAVNAAVAVFYVAVAVFAVIAASQVWVLANLAFDARQAKRLFGTFASGGIAGGIAGGYLASYLAPRWGGTCLLLLAAGFLVAAICSADALWRRAGAVTGRSESKPRPAKGLSLGRQDRVRDLWRDVLGSPHASWLALMVGLATVAGSLAEYQFSSLAAATIQDGDKLTAFFGFWLSNLSVFALLLQLAFSYRMLRTYGVGVSLMVLPMAVAGGGLAVLLVPSLWTGILAKIGDGSLKHSLNKSATELLYLPLPVRLRERSKMFIDVFVDNLATGIAGALLLFLSTGPGLSPRMVSLMILVLTAAWIPVILKVRKEYLNSFRKAMEKRTINVSHQTVTAGEAIIMDSMARALEGDNPRQLLYALDWIELAKSERHIERLSRLLSHPEVSVRLRTLQVLRRSLLPGFQEEARIMVRGDSDPAVRLGALRYLLRMRMGKDPVSLIVTYLIGNDLDLKETAVHALCLEAKRQPNLAEMVDWKSLLESFESFEGFENVEGLERMKDPENLGGPGGSGFKGSASQVRIMRVRLIGVSRLPGFLPELKALLNDSDRDVRNAAISAAGDTQNPSLLSDLLPHLLSPPTRIPARQAILACGEGVIPALRQAVVDPSLPPSLRRQVPGILGSLGSQGAAASLIGLLPIADPSLRFEVVKALNKIRFASPHFRFPHEALDRAILAELHDYYSLNAHLARLDRALAGKDRGFPILDGLASDLGLLGKAIQEKLQQGKERIFRLLGLRYHAGDIYGAYLGLVENQAATRANVIELLDNVLPLPLKRLLLPMVEIDSPAKLEAEMEGLSASPSAPWPDWLKGLLSSHDDWIKTLALNLLGKVRDSRLKGRAEEFLDYPDSRVMAAAQYAVSAFAPGISGSGTRVRTDA